MIKNSSLQIKNNSKAPSVQENKSELEECNSFFGCCRTIISALLLKKGKRTDEMITVGSDDISQKYKNCLHIFTSNSHLEVK